MEKRNEGWGAPGCSKKYHYFTADGRSLCMKIGFYRGEREQGNDDSPDNCAECRKRLARSKGAQP